MNQDLLGYFYRILISLGLLEESFHFSSLRGGELFASPLLSKLAFPISLFSSERAKWKPSKAKVYISERAQKLQVNKPLFSSERVKWKPSKAKVYISERAQKLQVNKPLFSGECSACPSLEEGHRNTPHTLYRESFILILF